MPFNLTTFKKSLSSAFKKIKSSQAEALAIEIAANYVAGRTAGKKHQSIKSAEGLPTGIVPADTAGSSTAAYTPAAKCTAAKLTAGEYTAANLTAASKEDTAADETEDEGLTTEEKAEIALLVALFLGYTSKFNDSTQAQILAKAKEIIDAGGSPEEVQQYVQDVFEGKEPIKIDNTGKTKKEIYVDKDLKLSEVDKIIEKPFFASVLTYAALTGENASHAAYEGGRKAQNISDGYLDWIFSGPADERARPHHIILIGERFTWGTIQSAYAERILHEPRCRHRSVPFYNDSRDVKKEVWDRLKKESGVFWNESLNKWDIN